MDILGFLNSHSKPSRLSFVSLSVQSWKTVLLAGVPTAADSMCSYFAIFINPLNAKLNPICHLLALLGVHNILHVSRVRVKQPTMLRFDVISVVILHGTLINYLSVSLLCFSLLSCVLLIVLCYLCLYVELFLLLGIWLLTWHGNK